MPRFMDHHPKGGPMPPEAVQQGMQMMQQLRTGIEAGKTDQYGVKALNVFMGADGEVVPAYPSLSHARERGG